MSHTLVGEFSPSSLSKVALILISFPLFIYLLLDFHILIFLLLLLLLLLSIEWKRDLFGFVISLHDTCVFYTNSIYFRFASSTSLC